MACSRRPVYQVRCSLACSGFTIIELLMAIAILAILTAVAVPSLRDLVVTARVRGAAEDIRASFQRARSEAVTRNSEVEVRVVGGDWAAGWELRTSALVIETKPALPGISVQPAPAASVTYRGNGRLSAGAQTIVVSAPGARARCVVLDASGRAAVKIDVDLDASNGCN